YNNGRQITNVVLESGDQLQYTYDDLDQLTGEKRVASDGTVLYNTSYAYDEVGNRTNKTVDGISVSYNFPYGAYGNRFSGWKVVSSGTLTGKLDVAGSSTETIGTNSYLGQLYVSNAAAWTPEVSTTNFIAYQAPVLSGTQQVVAAIGDVAGNAGYDTNTVVLKVVTNATVYYNTAGCIASILYDGTVGYTKTMSLSWNGLYQLTSVFTNGVVAESYQYDALGCRTAIISGTTTNYLVYDGIHVIAEVNASGVLQKSYTYGPGIDNILAMTDHTTANTYYFLTDHLGSVHAVVDSTGSIMESYRYDAWGKVLGVYDSNDKPLSESAIGNCVLWQGREYSWKTGLYYFRARWYDPITGRWVSKDPIGISGGLNQYVFCGNNPVNKRDPSGLHNWAWFKPPDEDFIVGPKERFEELYFLGIQAGGWLCGTVEQFGPFFHQLAHIHDPLSGFLMPEDTWMPEILQLGVELFTIPPCYVVAAGGCVLDEGGAVLTGTFNFAGDVIDVGLDVVGGTLNLAGDILDFINPFSGPSNASVGTVNTGEGGLISDPNSYGDK
ncbi:MAG: hypothetical protein E4H02_11580, partial [Lentisphaerales bacterium]